MFTVAQFLGNCRRFSQYGNKKPYTEGRNNDTPFGTWMGFPHQAWCASFLSQQAAEAGMPWRAYNDLQVAGRGFASVWLWGEWAKRHGLWTAVGRGRFYPGDVAVFKESHVEAILETHKDSFYSVGGNTNAARSRTGGQVFEHERKLSEVRGVIRLPFDVPAVASTPAPAPSSIPVLARSFGLTTPFTRSNDVKRWQQRMLDAGFKSIGKADGVYGPASYNTCRYLQALKGLHVDGTVGPVTWAKTFGG